MTALQSLSPRAPRVVAIAREASAEIAKPGQSREPVAQRIVATLEACAAHKRGLTLMEIVDATGLAKTTVHRMCWKLVELGLLDHTDQGFLIGSKLFELAGGNPSIDEMRNAVMPYLIELQRATGAMPHLAVLNGNTALIVDGLYPRGLAEPQRLLGAALPLHCTAVGKAIAAQLDPEEREALLFSRRLPASTRCTIVVPDLLRKQIERARSTGVAYSDEEFQTGVKAVAAGFRVRGGTTAAIGLMDFWNKKTITGAQKLLLRTVNELELQLA